MKTIITAPFPRVRHWVTNETSGYVARTARQTHFQPWNEHTMPSRRNTHTVIHNRTEVPPNSPHLLGNTTALPPVTVGCLFAAIGGFCKAFQLQNAKVLWANEKDKFARDTFVANFPNIRYLHKPIEDLCVTNDRLEPVDVLTAGFPCQPFSIAGEKRGFKDERGLLFLHIIRLINDYGINKPKILLLENVQHFKTHDRGRTFKRVRDEIQKAGYWFTESNSAILNTATHTHIPQNRARIFMVAMSSAFFPTNSFQFPPPVPEVERTPLWDFFDTRKKQPARYYFTEESQYYKPFLDAIDQADTKTIFQLRRSYVRENKSGTCFTLMANMGEGGHNQPVIKDRWGIRKLTPRECARLQGYDDSWFQIPENISHTQIYKQLGNSVTIPLVSKLAKECVMHLNNRRLELLNDVRILRNVIQ